MKNRKEKRGKSGYSYDYDYENRLIHIYLDANPNGVYDAGTDTLKAAFEYDALGRRIEKMDAAANTTTRYYYDDQRIALQTSVAGGTISYGYDALGRRVSRTQSGTTVYYVYDGPHIIAEYSSTGSLIRKYVYGPGMDNPVMMVRRLGSTDTRYYYYTDALGSVRLLTDAAGAVVESYTYDPYGYPRVMYTVGGVSGAGPDGNWLTEDVTTYQNSFLTRGNPILFTGRWWDNSTKLYYYRFRDYSPQLGRFCQPDPIGYADSMNLYQYCGNNPVNWIDPWGLLTVHYWPPGGTGSDKWHGHVSIELNNRTYISHWPADNRNYPYLLPSKANRNTYSSDMAGEGFRDPINFTVNGLDEGAIENWWNNHHAGFSMWHNCSDVATDALRAGGMDVPWHIINSPDQAVEDILKDVPIENKVDAAENWMKSSCEGKT